MNISFDLKYAWRLLNKSWGNSLLAACVVAFSVGLALWTYLLVYSQALKPLSFPGSDHWYSVQLASNETATSSPDVDAFTYQAMRNGNRTADYLGAFTGQAFVLSEGQSSASLRGSAISPRLLAATYVAPKYGRLFDETDSQPGATPTVILSFNTWKNYFASDPSVVGREVRLEAHPVRVVGVMPEDFFAFQDFELWVPLQLSALTKPSDSTLTLSPFIVVNNNQNTGAILNEMKAAVDGVNKDYPDLFKAGRHAELIPALRMSTHGLMQVIAILSFLAIAVLLLGGVNISMVFLARLLRRSRELALRTALGASRARLMRQCLLETALVVSLGLVGGCGLAGLGVRWTHSLYDFGSQIQGTGRDANVFSMRPIDLLVAVAAATLVWLLSTLIPARRIAKQDAALVLAGSGKGGAMSGSTKGAGILVGSQVLISCLVLVICGNLMLAVNHEVNKPLGLDVSHVLVTTDPTAFGSRYTQTGERERYWEDLASSIQGKVPGAQVAYTTSIPSRPSAVGMSLETQQGTEQKGAFTMPLTAVSDSFFGLLGISLRSGRLFDSTDNSASLNVAIVDERMAKRFWPGQNVLGKRIQLNPSEQGPWLTVVGVVSAVAPEPFGEDRGAVYQPLRQSPSSAFHLLVKLPMTEGNSMAALREAAFAVDRDLPLHNLQLLSDVLASLNLANSALVPVLVVIGSITALLAATGLFGLISRSVAQRTQEIGVRRALGSTQWQSLAIFLRQAAVYLGIGTVGVVLGIVISSVLSSIITNILDHAILVTLGVLLLMGGIIFAASYLPARRAVALEPGDALRCE